ncbi:hypothetical protein FOCC_FOCC016960, partial [Frankliniella occidentalis]
MPEEWQKAMLMPLPKKGDLSQCTNYRGIALLCTAYKVHSYFLMQRLEVATAGKIGNYQCGFRRKRSTMGVPQELVNHIKTAQENTKCAVQVNGLLPLFFASGVKQGDPIAPLLFNLNRPIRIATWNVRTMFKAGAARNVTSELLRMGVGIAGLQEMRWEGWGDLRMADYHLYWSGPRKGSRREHGVGFAIHKSLVPAVYAFGPVNKRLAVLLLRTQEENLAFVSCHAPCNSDKNHEEKTAFYDRLQKVVSTVLSKGAVKIILGDMNAQLGPMKDPKDKRRGKYTYHTEDNGNGNRLLSFASATAMTVVSTTSSRPKAECFTWSSPNGKVVSQIDHILVDTARAGWVTGAHSEWTACNDSDHAPVVAALKVKVADFKRTHTGDLLKSPKKLRVERLREDEVRDKFQERVAELLQRRPGADEVVRADDVVAQQEGGEEVRAGEAEEEVGPHEEELEESLDEIWQRIEAALQEGGEEVLGLQDKVTGQPWFDEECETDMERRNAYWRWHRESPEDEELREAYEESHNTLKSTLRRVRRRFLDQHCRDLDEARTQNDTKKFFEGVKRLKNGFVPRATMVRSEGGMLAVEVGQQLGTWQGHFEKVLRGANAVQAAGEEAHDDHDQDPGQNTYDARERTPPTREELVSVLEAMKKRKAPGADGIAMELLQCGGEALLDELTKLMVKIWEEEKIPVAWEEAVITVLHKGKGCIYDCDNYRGLSLLNTGYKVCSCMVLHRLVKYADKATGEYQAGFRRNRSTTDHIHAVRTIISKRRERHLDTHLLFIDFAKAYDSIFREVLWQRLGEMGIPQKLIAMMKALSKTTRNRVRILGFLSEAFETLAGVRQGDALSPQLFNLALESAIRRVMSMLGDEVTLLAYADDIVLIAETREHLTMVMALLMVECAKIGLQVNQGKTKYMYSSARPELPVMPLEVGEHSYEAVTSFRYLGSVITQDNDSYQDIRERTFQALRKMKALQAMLGSKDVGRE